RAAASCVGPRGSCGAPQPALRPMRRSLPSSRALVPGVYRCRRRLPDSCVVDTRQWRYGAKLGRHRDPVVGLGHDGRLACDRVAQHGEAVASPDHERIEAVEIVEGPLKRTLKRVAAANAPRQIRRRYLALVVALEPLALTHELLAQPIMIR